jgi:hypothetical protein
MAYPQLSIYPTKTLGAMPAINGVIESISETLQAF